MLKNWALLKYWESAQLLTIVNIWAVADENPRYVVKSTFMQITSQLSQVACDGGIRLCFWRDHRFLWKLATPILCQLLSSDTCTVLWRTLIQLRRDFNHIRLTPFCSDLKVCTSKLNIFLAQGKLVTNWWDSSRWIKVRQRWIKVHLSPVPLYHAHSTHTRYYNMSFVSFLGIMCQVHAYENTETPLET